MNNTEAQNKAIHAKAKRAKAEMSAPGVQDPNDIRHLIHGANVLAYNRAKKVKAKVI